jgi:hypothetical protein
MVIVAMEERWESIRSHIHRVAGLITTIIEDGIAKGEFRPQDARRSAECVSAAMASMCHPMLLAQCMNDPDKATPVEMAEFIVAALR